MMPNQHDWMAGAVNTGLDSSGLCGIAKAVGNPCPPPSADSQQLT